MAAPPTAPVLTSALTASGTVAQGFSYRITAINAPTGYGASGLPTGLALDSASGLISGTVAAAGSWTVSISASNAAGTGSATLVITVTAVGSLLAITSPSSARGMVGLAFAYQITGSDTPTGFDAANLPPGLGVDHATGLISGVPSTTGIYQVAIYAAGAAGTASADVVVSISPAASTGGGGGAPGGGSSGGHRCGLGAGVAIAGALLVLALRHLAWTVWRVRADGRSWPHHRAGGRTLRDGGRETASPAGAAFSCRLQGSAGMFNAGSAIGGRATNTGAENMVNRFPALLLLLTWQGALLPAQESTPFDPVGSQGLAAYNVDWDVPGPTALQSMPIGNGDIGLNVWVEPGGDVLFYIGKTDAWGENVHDSRGLMKLGIVRISLDPAPLGPGKAFHQLLSLHECEILISEGTGDRAAQLRLWVDANHPVIRIEASSPQPSSMTASMDTWRTLPRGDFTADTVVPGLDKRVAWYHHNGPRSEAPVQGRTFGAAMEGVGMVSKDAKSLRSDAPALSHQLSIYPLTIATGTGDEWQSQLNAQIASIAAIPLERARKEHRAWWDAFWHRSWIFIHGDPLAEEVTRGYLLQRFITACGGRGAYPIKFNGSIFNVDDPNRRIGNASQAVDADYRDWGGQYWFQNTRAMYWPRLVAGDFDIMLPLFRMYAAMIPANAAQVKQYYHHDGAYFAETAPFWGGLKYVGPETQENWTDHYFTPILELSMMMLDYYDFTGDRAFAKDTLIPVAAAGLTFFDQHFSRDNAGKLLLDPDNAIEMFWKVHDPAPDIAGLRAVLPRMLALPDELVETAQKSAWRRLVGEIPELPVGMRNGKRLLLPYTGAQTAKPRNGENPELYAIYPFRIFGITRPDLDLALRSFLGRRCKQRGCWVQDPIQAAMIGLGDVAQDYVSFALTRRDPSLKFPAFWAHGNDYQPDQDNGGNGEHGLQSMLLQSDGRKILVMPAWPKSWDVSFSLNAPGRTTVRGRYEHGAITELDATPMQRRADLVDLSQRPPHRPAVRAVPGSSPGMVASVLAVADAVIPLKATTAGGANHLDALTGGEGAKCAIDGNLDSKYFNRSGDGADPNGVGTGFLVSPASRAVVTAFQLATANDMPDRDLLAVTIEGSDDAQASSEGGGGFVLLYSGLTGMDADPGRKHWSPAIAFPNTRAFRTYRVLVTETRADGADGTQYSEFRLGSLVP